MATVPKLVFPRDNELYQHSSGHHCHAPSSITSCGNFASVVCSRQNRITSGKSRPGDGKNLLESVAWAERLASRIQNLEDQQLQRPRLQHPPRLFATAKITHDPDHHRARLQRVGFGLLTRRAHERYHSQQFRNSTTRRALFPAENPRNSLDTTWNAATWPKRRDTSSSEERPGDRAWPWRKQRSLLASGKM